MSSKNPLQRYRLAAMLSLGLLVGGLAGQSLSAPAPAPHSSHRHRRSARLVPMAPVGPGAAGPGRRNPGAINRTGRRRRTGSARCSCRSSACGCSPTSAVQAPRIVVIDRQQLLQRSAAGKDIFTQTQTLSKQLETQLQDRRGGSSRPRPTQLQQQMAIMAADVRAQKEKDFTPSSRRSRARSSSVRLRSRRASTRPRARLKLRSIRSCKRS